MYRQFAFWPEKELVREVQSYGIPMSLHICGDTNKIIEDMGRTGAGIIEIDWKLDMKKARKLLPESAVLMGNVNPSDPLVLGSPDDVRQAVRQVIEDTGGRRLFISSGCALGRNTPPENLMAMIGGAREYGSYDRLMQLCR